MPRWGLNARRVGQECELEEGKYGIRVTTGRGFGMGLGANVIRKRRHGKPFVKF